MERGSRTRSDWTLTRLKYDVLGNLTAVTDPLGRQATAYVYDTQGRLIKVQTLDGGTRTVVLDGAGNPIEERDSKGSVVLREYDPLSRLSRVWARERRSQRVTLRELHEYGDAGNPAQPGPQRAANRGRNRLGRPARVFDEAGRLDILRYDFKGNAVQRSRRVVADGAIATGFVADWSAPDAEASLDGAPYVTERRFDALNRMIELRYPLEARPWTPGAPRQRALLGARYDAAGALTFVELDGRPYLEQAAHNARASGFLPSTGAG